MFARCRDHSLQDLLAEVSRRPIQPGNMVAETAASWRFGVMSVACYMGFGYLPEPPKQSTETKSLHPKRKDLTATRLDTLEVDA